MIKTSGKKINEIFDFFNIPKNSYVMIHSSVFVFGKIENGIKTLLKFITNNFSQDRTVIFPSFTYSFRRNEIFNVNQTPADPHIGVLSELVRKNKNSLRNDDPLFSLISIGQDKNIINRSSKKCFGKNSVFDKLFYKNFFILSLGVEFTNGITEFMHIEKLANVPYRYEKLFNGYVINKENKKIIDKAYHFIKNENFFKKHYQSRESFGQTLISKKICKNIKYGYGDIFLIHGKNFFDFSLQMLKKNPFIMIQKKEINFKDHQKN